MGLGVVGRVGWGKIVKLSSPLFLHWLLLLLDLSIGKTMILNWIQFVSNYLHLIVALAAEVEDRLGGGEVRVGVGG